MSDPRTTSIEELAKERVVLQDRLMAFDHMNVYGQTIESLTEANVDKIKTQRRLFEVEGRIQNYIEGKTS